MRGGGEIGGAREPGRYGVDGRLGGGGSREGTGMGAGDVKKGVRREGENVGRIRGSATMFEDTRKSAARSSGKERGGNES